MWTRRRIARTTAVLAALAFLAWLTFHSSEPSYHGKSLSAWLEQARQNKEIENPFSDVNLDTPSARAVRAMGKDALPLLIRMARTRDTPLRENMINLSQHYGWLGLHPQRFQDIQLKTAYGFLVLGPVATNALPALISMLDDPDPDLQVRRLAAFAIAKIGPDAASAIPALQRLITNSVPPYPPSKALWDDVGMAAYALGAMGHAARSALPQIESLRNDPNFLVRAPAETALIKISGNGLDAFLEPLKNPFDSTNWFFAAYAIDFLGSNGTPAIPFLIRDLQSTNASVRDAALRALSAIHMSPETTIPAILPLVAATHTNAAERATALTALHNFGPTARDLVPMSILLQAMQDPDENIRIHATNALRQIDPEAARNAGIDSGDERK